AAVRVERILNRERVEATDFLEERHLVPVRDVDVHPELADLSPDRLEELGYGEIAPKLPLGRYQEAARQIGVAPAPSAGRYPFGNARTAHVDTPRRGCGHFNPRMSWKP